MRVLSGNCGSAHLKGDYDPLLDRLLDGYAKVIVGHPRLLRAMPSLDALLLHVTITNVSLDITP
jgi:hypothetical protein